MKKILAIMLAALMLVGMLTACGETKPTETTEPVETTETTEPTETTPEATAPEVTESTTPRVAENLRDGETVVVADQKEFFAAYAALYAPDSNVNCIQLDADMNIAKFGEFSGKVNCLPEGTDESLIPHLSDVGYVVVRMPEGTALDLNGYKLTLRALQGLDDEKGEPSGLTTLGQVIDSFEEQGGALVLWAWKDNGHLDAALKVAEENPGLVKSITITTSIGDAEGHDYVIPEGVALTFMNNSCEIAANSITFKSGASCIVGKEAIGVKKTPTVIFECKTEEDHNRPGIEFATEVIDVE